VFSSIARLLARLGMYSSKEATFSQLRNTRISSARNQAHLKRAGRNLLFALLLSSGRQIGRHCGQKTKIRHAVRKIKKGPSGAAVEEEASNCPALLWS